MGKWIPQTTVTNFYHIHEAVLSQHAFIVLFEHVNNLFKVKSG